LFHVIGGGTAAYLLILILLSMYIVYASFPDTAKDMNDIDYLRYGPFNDKLVLVSAYLNSMFLQSIVQNQFTDCYKWWQTSK
jgi:hypothetical protein